MIKGKTIIELTDVNTGEVERHEDDNMVTNALNKIFEPLGYFKDPTYITNAFFPLCEKALGGILLFDGHIEENANTIFAPATLKMTGCGVYGIQNTTNFTYRGNYNMTESEIDTKNKYAKYVYDFPTNIANGEIACVCLTSNIGGYCGYGTNELMSTNIGGNNIQDITVQFPGVNARYRKSGNDNPGNVYFLFAIDEENDIAFYFAINSLSISILKRKTYIKSISVFDSPNTYGLGDLIDKIDIEITGAGLKNIQYFSYNFDPESMNLYIISGKKSTVNVGEKLGIVEFHLLDNTVTEYEVINTYSVNVDSGSYGSYQSLTYVYKGSLFLSASSGGKRIIRFNIESSEVEAVMDVDDVSTTYFTGIHHNGLIYISTSYSYERIINTDKNEIYCTEHTAREKCCIPMLNPGYWLEYNTTTNTMRGKMLMNYLATINNLSSPVVKTADKTMKVTYIIQEVAE